MPKVPQYNFPKRTIPKVSGTPEVKGMYCLTPGASEADKKQDIKQVKQFVAGFKRRKSKPEGKT